ncbi:unnamed protein product [Mytilus edulis]|uniref:PHD-type domain-containing protein n=1 Tax=Mytilus edulis TaxID=6550 RepID=A0A8S3PZY8_MYTED|nr:unnamed protein product [Mytilus edulis]
MYTGGGHTYVRWGRTTCPSISGTKLVYSGYTGGGMYHHPGRPAEPVCLPTNPNFVKTSGTNVAFIYGAEYENNFFASNSVHQDVPCSVCHVQFGTTIMIPGKTRCHKGWKLQYKGNLAAGHSGHGGASTYLCVDFNQQYMHGGSADKNGYLLFDVVGQCGSLPCPPYHNGYPLTIFSTKQGNLIDWFVGSDLAKNAVNNNILITEEQVEARPELLTASCLDSIVNIDLIKKYCQKDAWEAIKSVYKEKKKNPIYICNICTHDADSKEASVMCSSCLEWQHLSCARLKQLPKAKNWFCNNCKC